MTDQKRYVAYARQSVARSGDKGDSASVADQFLAMETYAERAGGRILKRFSDVDVSGSTESREGLDRLLTEIKDIKPDAVLIRDVSRLARDTRIFLTLVDTIQRSGVQLLSTTESLEDRTLSVVISAFAERERLALAGRVAGGMREHVRRGKTFGRAPFGYRRIAREMFIYEPEAAVVRDVFAWFASGLSVTMILNKLNGDPMTLKPPETAVWKHSTVAKMLRRPVYRGAAIMDERRDIAGRLWPAVVTEDAHPAIVDAELWRRANRRWRDPVGIVRGDPVSPLSGLLWCARCGGRIYAVEQKRAHRPSNVRAARCGTRVYQAREGDVAPSCPSVKGSMALGAVELISFAAVDDLLRRLASPAQIRAALAELSLKTAKRDDAELARKRLDEIERRRSRLLDAYESGGLDLTTWTGRDRVLGADADVLRAAIAAIPPVPDADALIDLRDELDRVLASGEKLDYRALLSGLGGRVVFDLDAKTADIEVSDDFAPLFFRLPSMIHE